MYFAGSVLRAKVKVIAAVVRGLLEEVLKDHVGEPQFRKMLRQSTVSSK